MSVSLYRKYRPQDFASVVGQKPAVSILTNALTKNSAGHAYLFSGSRGCGKTSIARIFAKALNCLEPNGFEPCGKCRNCTAITAGESLDVIEIDGASNNGVENIRNLRENISLSPFSSKYKIYIIDEVHMLSQGAFNALLKTLEEPPDFVVFIMATTEPYKVPVTIRSRCQHIPFHSISTEDIASRLEYVCSAEGVKADTEALYEIARQADGALRDGLSLLEQVISSGEITLENVEGLLGAGSRSAFERVAKYFRTDPAQGYAELKGMFDGGASPVRVFEELFSLVRNMWLVSRWRGMSESLGLSKSERRFLSEEVPNWKPDSLHYMLDRILKALTKARQGMRTDILLGSFMLSLARPPANLSQQMPSVQPANVSQQMPSVQPTNVSQKLLQNSPANLSQQMPQISPANSVQPQASAAPAAVSAFQEKAAFPEKPAKTFDPKLKEVLLAIAHEGDFTVYCALFDVRPFIEDNCLMLYVEHAYCYDRLRLDDNASELAKMFKEKYSQVILRYGKSETVCRERPNFRPKLPDYAANIPDTKSLDVLLLPKTENTSQAAAAPQAENSSPDEFSAITHEASGIDTVRRQLAMLGANPEVLLRFHRQNNDNDNDVQLEEEDDD